MSFVAEIRPFISATTEGTFFRVRSLDPTWKIILSGWRVHDLTKSTAPPMVLVSNVLMNTDWPTALGLRFLTIDVPIISVSTFFLFATTELSTHVTRGGDVW